MVLQGNFCTLILLSKKSDSEISDMQVGSGKVSDKNENNPLVDDEVPF